MENKSEIKFDPKNKLEHYKKIKTSPWPYLMIVALVLLFDTMILYVHYYDNYESFEGITIILTVLFSLIFIAFFVAYWNITIDMQITKYKKLVVEKEITEIPENLELDIDKNLIKLSYKYLDQYYLQTREHAQKGFAVTIGVSIAGAIILAGGIIALFIGKTNPAYVTTATGIITEFISAIYFYLYNKTVQGMGSYHNKLVLSQNIALALKLSNSLENKSDEAKLNIINELVKDINTHIEK